MLAGGEGEMLAFFLFEELSNWFVNQIVIIYSKLKIDNIVLTGNFFANPVLTGKLIKSYSNHNLFINKNTHL